MAKYVYPAVFETEPEGGYSISFPDLPGCYSQGSDLTDAMYMANDALPFWLCYLEDESRDIPEASRLEDVEKGPNSFVTYIACDTLEYRKNNSNRAVKKTLSIPEWLNRAAVDAGVNFSQILQDALKEKLELG